MTQRRVRRRIAVLLALLPIALVLTDVVHCAQSSAPLPPASDRASIALDASLSGVVTEFTTGQPVEGARITLFEPSLSFFRETRTALDGTYTLSLLPSGAYRLGVATPGLEYVEQGTTLLSGPNVANAALVTESHVGRWDVIGDTLPELFDATDIGVLRPDGVLYFCHDTTDPILFDPVTGGKLFPPSSSSEQGCMNVTLLEDGSALIVGGQAGSAPANFVNGIPWVKRFGPSVQWQDLPDMQHALGRWYPGLARLNDGRVIVMGGGQSPDATRTNTCELFDLQTQTWSYTDPLENPVEFPPSALLHDGDVLQTWGGQPELFDPTSETWSNTGNFVFPNRGYPGHSDHRLLVLTDGRALAVGVRRTGQPNAEMTEYYDPGTGQWSIGTSPDLVRMQAEAVYLPDGQVLVAAGDKESTGGPEPNVLGIVRRCDLFDPIAGGWRRVADMTWFREYHQVTLLLHDGRVMTTGGTRIKFQFGPTSADIEAYSPPYLFRGVRPEISNLSDDTPPRGSTVRFDVFPGTALTGVVLMGMQSTTHWVDCGIPRRLELPVVQAGSSASVTLPADPDLLPLGWYLLFGMVDDIPSIALSVRVDP